MTEKLVALTLRASSAIEGRRDAGQGALEYTGMIIVAAIVALAVFTAVKGANVAAAITTAIRQILTGA